MTLVRVLATIGYLALLLFLIALVLRWVFSLVAAFARDWKPSGALLVIVEGVYTITDPPIKALRRVLPPVGLGPVRLDLAFLIVWLVCMFGMLVLQAVAA